MPPQEALSALRNDPERRETLRQRLSRYLDVPMALVSILMGVLGVLQLSGRANHWQSTLIAVQLLLWALFAVEFAIKLGLPPSKRRFLRNHWFDVLIVLFPFVAFLRIYAAMRGLVRFSVESPWSFGPYLAILRRRHLGRLAVISILVLLISAVLEYLFEAGAHGSNITSFSQAVWWAAATATTIGSQFYPVTSGGGVQPGPGRAQRHPAVHLDGARPPADSAANREPARPAAAARRGPPRTGVSRARPTDDVPVGPAGAHNPTVRRRGVSVGRCRDRVGRLEAGWTT